MSLEGIFQWFSEQVQYILLFVLFIVLLAAAYKRAWLTMIGSLIGLAFIGIFVVNPEVLLSLSEWLGGQLDLGA